MKLQHNHNWKFAKEGQEVVPLPNGNRQLRDYGIVVCTKCGQLKKQYIDDDPEEEKKLINKAKEKEN